MWLWLLATTFSWGCEAQICDTICKRDGDKAGIIINGQCGCWNPTDYKVHIKVPKHGWVSKDNKERYYYGQ